MANVSRLSYSITSLDCGFESKLKAWISWLFFNRSWASELKKDIGTYPSLLSITYYTSTSSITQLCKGLNNFDLSKRVIEEYTLLNLPPRTSARTRIICYYCLNHRKFINRGHDKSFGERYLKTIKTQD